MNYMVEKKILFRKKKTCSAEVTPLFTNILVSIILVVKWPDFFGVCGSDDDVYHNVKREREDYNNESQLYCITCIISLQIQLSHYASLLIVQALSMPALCPSPLTPTGPKAYSTSSISVVTKIRHSILVIMALTTGSSTML